MGGEGSASASASRHPAIAEAAALNRISPTSGVYQPGSSSSVSGMRPMTAATSYWARIVARSLPPPRIEGLEAAEMADAADLTDASITPGSGPASTVLPPPKHRHPPPPAAGGGAPAAAAGRPPSSPPLGQMSRPAA